RTDLTLRRRINARDQPQNRTLAGSVGADDRDGAAPTHAQVEPRQPERGGGPSDLAATERADEPFSERSGPRRIAEFLANVAALDQREHASSDLDTKGLVTPEDHIACPADRQRENRDPAELAGGRETSLEEYGVVERQQPGERVQHVQTTDGLRHQVRGIEDGRCVEQRQDEEW